jgi:hypothetical protein
MGASTRGDIAAPHAEWNSAAFDSPVSRDPVTSSGRPHVPGEARQPPPRRISRPQPPKHPTPTQIHYDSETPQIRPLIRSAGRLSFARGAPRKLEARWRRREAVAMSVAIFVSTSAFLTSWVWRDAIRPRGFYIIPGGIRDNHGAHTLDGTSQSDRFSA